MSTFLRGDLRDAPPYVPGEQVTGVIKLNTNESPYPPSPKAVEAMKAETARLMRYPPPDADDARDALARLLRVAPAQVFVGNGSDEILRIAFQAYLEPGARVAWSTPTYSLYDVLARFSSATVVDVPRRADFSVDIDALAAADAALTVLASPNSPTGTVTSIDEIDRLAASVRLLLVDEAYADFAGVTAASLAARRDNVIVCRTLSKSYSLAGLRVGFAVASPAIIADYLLLKDSYNVSRIANVGAAAALDDRAYAEELVAKITATRARLGAALERLGWNVSPSGANFLFAVPPGGEGEKMYRMLRDRNILVRWFGNDPRTAAGVRITVGTDDEIDRLLEVIGHHE